MKRSLLLLLSLFVLFSAFAKKQTRPVVYTNEQIQSICDSVVAEGNLLYRYQKAAKLGVDTALMSESVKNEFFSYVLYDVGDTMKLCLVNADLQCIYEADFVGKECEPLAPRLERRELTPMEHTFFKVRNIMHTSVIQWYYEINIPEVTIPNLVFIPSEEGYKFYLLLESKEPDLVPFGSDYLFWGNSKGRITDWRKLHQGFRGLDLNVKRRLSGAVREIEHNHLINEPFVTATDICIMKREGPKYGVKKLIVFSPALGKTMTYDTDTDQVTIAEVPAAGE